MQGSNGAASTARFSWLATRPGPGCRSHDRCAHAAKIPRSALNDDYEYGLPTHLALIGPTHTTTTTSPAASAAIQCQGVRTGGTTFPAAPTSGIRIDTVPGFQTSLGALRLGPMPPAITAAAAPRRSDACEIRTVCYADVGSDPGSAPVPQQVLRQCRTDGLAVSEASLEGDTDELGNTAVLAPYTVGADDNEEPLLNLTDGGKAMSCSEWRVPVPTTSTQQRSGVPQHTQQPFFGTDWPSTDRSMMHAVPHRTQSIPCPWASVLGDAGAAGVLNEAESRVADLHARSSGKCAAVRRLHRQLDSFGENDLFLERWVMLGREQRCRGGALRAARNPDSIHAVRGIGCARNDVIVVASKHVSNYCHNRYGFDRADLRCFGLFRRQKACMAAATATAAGKAQPAAH